MFDYSLDYKNTDFRANPHLYRVGKGEQGVLLVEPYKSEILPFWRFKTPAALFFATIEVGTSLGASDLSFPSLPM